MGLLSHNHNRTSGEYANGATGQPGTHEHSTLNGPAHTGLGHTAGNPYSGGNATVNGGYGGQIHEPGTTGPLGGTHGSTGGNQFTGGFGGGTGGPVGSHGTHTGPAPLAGVHANHNGTGTGFGNTTTTNGTHGTGLGTGATGTHTTGAGTHGTFGTHAAGAPTVREANKLERKAKMESTVGGLLCSSSMKAKAHDHAAQADHLRMQASELGEAQRLENEAGMRRQRAVGLGADPAHASGTTGYAPR